MKATGFGLSHVGRVRARNEDSIHIDEDGRFALMADGMGGHRGGQEASRMTIDLVRAALERLHFEGFPSDDSDARSALRETFKSAAVEVATRGRQVQELENMGTTLVCWTLHGGAVHVAHVGDSRAYLLRDGNLFQVTLDHVLGHEQIRMGMPRDQAERIPLKHVLVRNIGVSPPSEPDIARFDALPGDAWLLCSDGLSNKLLHGDLLHLLTKSRGSSSDALRSMVEEAWHRGGEDNISAILMNLHPGA